MGVLTLDLFSHGMKREGMAWWQETIFEEDLILGYFRGTYGCIVCVKANSTPKGCHPKLKRQVCWLYLPIFGPVVITHDSIQSFQKKLLYELLFYPQTSNSFSGMFLNNKKRHPLQFQPFFDKKYPEIHRDPYNFPCVPGDEVCIAGRCAWSWYWSSRGE